MATHHNARVSANYIPGGHEDSYYMPPQTPELISPEPQRHMPEMSHQIQHGLQNMSLDYRASTSTMATDYQHEISGDYSKFSKDLEMPSFNALPKLKNPPANVPPSDEEFEATLWDARTLVLESTDAEMQLAWAADALIYVGVCADNEERLVAAKPGSARSATPNIEHSLRNDAISIIDFLAGQNHPKAEFLKGTWLETGRYGQREDKKEAFRCYSRAVDKGYVRAEYRIGMLYESSNDATKALRHYHRGVDAGDSACSYRLGMMTLRGQHGQQQDWARGVDLIRRSADTADENAAQGAYVYGMLLARELPQVDVPQHILPPNESKAKMYIEKAAFLKFAKAQLKMGSAYELGAMCCDFDPALSMHYYALAAKQGEAEADMALSKWFLVGHDGLFPKNEQLAYTYAERAASTGLPTAEFALGYFHEIGMSTPINLDKALLWYQKASDHGNEDARARVQSLGKRQYLSKKDHDKVAIQRIKSVHNSMANGRPPRQQDSMPMMPKTSNAYGAPGYVPRAASVAPYPVDERPNMGGRSASALPYPTHDGPPPGHMNAPRSGSSQWTQQPPRPATTTNFVDTRPSHPGDGRSGYQGSPRPQQQQYNDPRYASTSLNPRPHPNSGYPSGPPQQYNQRVVSSPSYMQHNQQGYGAPSPRLGPGPSPRPMNGSFQGRSGPPPPPPPKPMNVGYSAPHDPRPNMNGHPSQQRLPQSNSAPNFGQNVGRPQQQQSSRPPANIPPKDPAPAPKPLKPAGPKTFDEMGVPSKKRDDCVMM